MNITLDYLRANGTIEQTAIDGTCQLWKLEDGSEYVVLADNTIITLEEFESVDPLN